MFTKIVYALVLLANIQFASALGGGSPICEINAERLGFMHGTTQDLGYSIKVEPAEIEAGGSVTITIEGGAYVGLLLYVEGKEAKTHYGEFSDYGAEFKEVSAGACEGITGKPTATLTHAQSVTAPGSFKWTISAEEAASGTFTVQAVVVDTMTDLKHQVVAPVEIKVSEGGPDLQGQPEEEEEGGAGPLPDPTPPKETYKGVTDVKKKKCTKIAKKTKKIYKK